jgi:hypothetical protein
MPPPDPAKALAPAAAPDDFLHALVEELRPLVLPLSASTGTALACVGPDVLHWVAAHPTCLCSQSGGAPG